MPLLDDLSDNDFGSIADDLRFNKKRKSKYPPLPKETEESIVRKALDSGVGGLQWLGETLDKPGRALRGLAAGRPDQLANLIPFSDTMGITSPSDSTSGRDLLEKAGIAGPNQKGLDVGDVAGFGTEIALDPLTYMTFGLSALGKAGKVAKAAGVAIKGNKYKTLGQVLHRAEPEVLQAVTEAAAKHGTTVAELSGQKLGGLMGFKVPGMESVMPEMMQGPTAEAIGKGLSSIPSKTGQLIEKLPLGGPTMDMARGAGRMWKAAFDPSVRGQTTELGQEVGRAAYEQAGKGHTQALKEFTARSDELNDLVGEFHQHYGMGGSMDDSISMVRRAVQKAAETKTNQPLRELGAHAPPLEGRVHDLGQKFAEAQNLAKENAFNAGIDIGSLPETNEFQHLFRQPNQRLTADAATKGQSRQLKISSQGAMARDTGTKFFPIETIESVLRDPQVINAQHADRANVIDALYPREMQTASMASGKTTAELSGGLAEFVRKKGDHYLKTGDRYYSDDVAKMHLDYLSGLNQAKANADGIHAFLSKNSVPAGVGTIPIEDAYKAAGMDPHRSLAYSVNKFGMPAGLHVPEDVATAAKSLNIKRQSPEWLQAITDVIDKGTRFIKTNLTLPFPSFHTRNFASGQWMNLASNAIETPADLGLYRQAFSEAKAIAANKASSRDIINEMVVHRTIPTEFGTRDVDILSGVNLPPVPDKTSILSTLDPRAAYTEAKAAGNGPIKTGYDTVVQHGINTAHKIEYMNHAPMYLYLKKKGWSPEAAAAKVRELQVDYGDLTDFEKGVMKRTVPFYCVPDSTPALTRDGWKSCDEIEVGDELLTYNQYTDRMEWKPCLEVAVFDFNGELVSMHNSRHKILCTENHRWAVTRKSRQRDDGSHGIELYETKDLNWDCRIVAAAKLTAVEPSILTEEQARLLGWLVTDGYWRRRGNYVEAMIYQHPSKFLDEVMVVAGGKPRKPHPDSGVICVPVLKERTKEIEQYLDKDNLVSVVSRLSRWAAEAMYDAMYKGDGTVATRMCDFLAAQNRGVRDAFQVLCAMLGKRSAAGNPNSRGIVTGCTISKCRTIGVKDLQIGRERYVGRVWCPRTENGTWVMRQGRLITITGNTFARKNIPVLIQQMLERPGGPQAQMVRASNIGRGESEFVPSYVGEGMSVPLPGQEGQYLSGLGLPTDQFGELMATGPTFYGTVKRTGQKLLSHLTPPLKAAVEIPTGTNLFSGKDYREMYQYPTKEPLTNAVLGNSPLSRYISMWRTGGDPRKELPIKAVNMLTGARITDVSGGLEKQRSYAAKKIIDEVLREEPGIGSVSDLYVKEGAKLSPKAEELYRAYRGVVGKQQEAARKKAKQKKPPQ